MAPKASTDRLLAENVGTLLSRTARRLAQAVLPVFEAMGEPAASGKLLAWVCKEGPLSQQEIALVAAFHPTGVSRSLDELESRGLVRRRRDPSDRRKVLVEATAAGRAKYEKFMVPATDALDGVMRRLTTSDRQTLQALLEKLLAEEVPQSLGRASGT